MRKPYRIPDGLLEAIDGVEIWNCAYDGSLVPNPRSIDLYLKTRATHPALASFVGSDLHRLLNLRKLSIRVRLPSLDERGLLGSLRSGSFRGVSRLCEVSGRLSGNWAQRLAFRSIASTYATVQRLRAALRRGRPSRAPHVR
jgi:hypothetical protein